MRSTLSSLQLPSKHFNFKRIKEDIFINSLHYCVFATLTILLFVGIDRNEYRQGMTRQILQTLTLRLIKTMTQLSFTVTCLFVEFSTVTVSIFNLKSFFVYEREDIFAFREGFYRNQLSKSTRLPVIKWSRFVLSNIIAYSPERPTRLY